MNINVTIPSVTIDVHYHGATADQLGTVLSLLEQIMATQAELATSLGTVTAQVAKIGDETRTLLVKIQELTDAISQGGATTPEVDAALAALQAQVAVVDELVADVSAP